MAKYYKCSLVKTFTGQMFNINSLLSLYLVSLFCKSAVKTQDTKSKIRPRRGSISLLVTSIFTAVLQKKVRLDRDIKMIAYENLDL